jgi:hypothetical protein
MITVPGQLAIKTRHGRYGAFNVGYLSTRIGEFVTKNAELDQYDEGKYQGDFIITEIFPSTYSMGGRIVVEMRVRLGGMTLSNIDALTTDEAHRLSPEEVDPVDEEAPKPAPAVSTPLAPTVPTASEAPPLVDAPAPTLREATTHPLLDTTPFGADTAPKSVSEAEADTSADATLFGALWPLSELVKLDATVDRRLLRQQRDRLDALGYEFQPLKQEWHLKVA